MIRIVLILLLSACSTELQAQKDKNGIEGAIVGFFNGLSLVDTDTLHNYTTKDFELLENGHVWNLDTLIAKVMPRKNSDIRRINKFDFITTEQNNNMAWVSYHNAAEFTQGEKKQIVRWLESAVLIKNNNGWQIRMLHSTKVK